MSGAGFGASKLGDQHDDVLVEDSCRVALATGVFQQDQAARPKAPGLAIAGRYLNRAGEVALKHPERGGLHRAGRVTWAHAG